MIETVDVPVADGENILPGHGGRIPDFPGVSVYPSGFYFNTKAAEFLEGVEAFALKLTREWLILTPVPRAAHGAVALSSLSSARCRRREVRFMREPQALAEKKIPRGLRKLYRCKQGFAISRFNVEEVSRDV